MKRTLGFVAIVALLTSACGDLTTATSPSVTTGGCMAQRNGSTVSILDVEAPCR